MMDNSTKDGLLEQISLAIEQVVPLINLHINCIDLQKHEKPVTIFIPSHVLDNNPNPKSLDPKAICTRWKCDKRLPRNILLMSMCG